MPHHFTLNIQKNQIILRKDTYYLSVLKKHTLNTPEQLKKEICMSETPSAFSISHYVLLFIVSTLCTISVVWVLIAANNREAAIHDNQILTHNKHCQRNAADSVTTIWKHRPNEIPPKYKLMERNYANRVVDVRTTGTCNGKNFTCQMGDIRSSCDPCATNSAQKRAMFQHISDTIDDVCKKY